MRPLVTMAVLLGAGCDQVFGLTRSSAAIDASTSDEGLVDAGTACPALGGTPTFSMTLHLRATGCAEYNASTTGRAVANCTGVVSEGPAAGPLIPVVGLESMQGLMHDASRMVPEGDLLFVREWNTQTVFSRILVERRLPGDTFAFERENTVSGMTLDTSARFGVPTRGPVRRMLLRNRQALVELAIDALGAASVMTTYTENDLGVDNVALVPNLSADGLQMVFGGSGTPGGSGVYYADRASLGDRFGAARRVGSVPYSYDPWLGEACSELAFSVGTSVYAVDAAP